MSEYSAKTLREKMKAKARSLAGEKDQKTDSSDWTPAPLLKAEIKTGARPIMKPSAKGIGESNAARDTKAAIGRDMKRGAFKSGGAVKDAGVKDKKALGAIDPSPKRGAAGHYAKGGSINKKPAKTLYTKDQLRGDKLQKLIDNADYDEDLKRIKDSLDAHGFSVPRSLMPPSDSSGYKKGGKIKKAGGGSFLEKMVGKPKGSDYSQVGKMGTAQYSQEDKGALNRALKGDDALPSAGEAMERSGKYQPYKKGGRTAKAAGGSLISAMKGAAKKGAKKKGAKTDINIVINAGGKSPARHPADRMAPPADMGAMPPPPPPSLGIAGPPPAGPVGDLGGGAPMVPPGLPIGRKAGGRITKVAKSYKDMEAGAASGEGRLQKTEIAKSHKDAPARKAGGRISKVAKSYKDMTAGAASGEGRLQKEDIAKAKKGRSK